MSFEPYIAHFTIVDGFPEANSQTFVKGNLVYKNTDGFIAECGTDPAAIFGVAAQDAHNSASAQTDKVKVAVYVITPDSLWVAKSNTTTAQAHAGTASGYGVVEASSVWKVDISETTNTRVNILKLDARDAVGTDGGRYIVAFKSANIQSHL